jgi:hypothetical protein
LIHALWGLLGLGGNLSATVENINRFVDYARTLQGDEKGQGCSTLFVVVHIAQGFEASEGSGVAILGDGVGLVEPQDIVSEAA